MKAKRKRRLDKKLHKYWLSLGVVDASLVSAWRRKLLDAHEFDEFSIDSDNCDELWSDTRAALKKYQLSYRVARVPNSEAESWLSDGGMVVLNSGQLNIQASKYFQVIIQIFDSFKWASSTTAFCLCTCPTFASSATSTQPIIVLFLMILR